MQSQPVVEADLPNSSVVIQDQSAALWSTDDLKLAQNNDPDVGFIYRLMESRVSKPTWNEIVHHSKDVYPLGDFGNV